jgi:hypothetical protein
MHPRASSSIRNNKFNQNSWNKEWERKRKGISIQPQAISVDGRAKAEVAFASIECQNFAFFLLEVQQVGVFFNVLLFTTLN